MITIREFLSNRRTEIKQHIADMRAELQDIDTLESTLSGPRAKKAPSDKPARARGRRRSTETLRDMALAVLKNRPEGVNASQLVAAIKDKFGVDVERASLSPQLSRLNKDGLIRRDGYTWFPVESARDDVVADQDDNPLSDDRPYESYEHQSAA
jgi:DNA-binding transcriptional ArsR family regulator